jgi:hypothetical protein
MKIKNYLLALVALLSAAVALAYTTIPSGHTVIRLLAGTKTVSLAATPEPLSSANAYVVSVLIEPATTTQGPCYVGAAGSESIQLPAAIPGFIISGSVLNLKDLYISVAANGDAVKYTALYR